MAEKCERCGKTKILLFQFYSCPDGDRCTIKDDLMPYRGNKFLCPKCGTDEVEPFPHYQFVGLYHCLPMGHVWLTS